MGRVKYRKRFSVWENHAESGVMQGIIAADFTGFKYRPYRIPELQKAIKPDMDARSVRLDVYVKVKALNIKNRQSIQTCSALSAFFR